MFQNAKGNSTIVNAYSTLHSLKRHAGELFSFVKIYGELQNAFLGSRIPRFV